MSSGHVVSIHESCLTVIVPRPGVANTIAASLIPNVAWLLESGEADRRVVFAKEREDTSCYLCMPPLTLAESYSPITHGQVGTMCDTKGWSLVDRTMVV
jgi:hypothetical protein